MPSNIRVFCVWVLLSFAFLCLRYACFSGAAALSSWQAGKEGREFKVGLYVLYVQGSRLTRWLESASLFFF